VLFLYYTHWGRTGHVVFWFSVFLVQLDDLISNSEEADDIGIGPGQDGDLLQGTSKEQDDTGCSLRIADIDIFENVYWLKNTEHRYQPACFLSKRVVPVNMFQA